MNVGIQESEHFEGIYPVIRLFDTGRNQLFIFVNAHTRDRLVELLGTDANRYQWIIQDKNESTFNFCRRIRTTIHHNKLQILYLNTISKHHLWFALLIPPSKKLHTILTVHDVNCLFHDKLNLSPRSWLRWLGKKLLVKRVKAFNTVSETVQPYLTEQTKKTKKVYTIPGAVYEKPGQLNNKGNQLHIVIPGSIDPKRRDYLQVFTLLEQATRLPLKITLLGGGSSDYAQEIWKTCRLRNLPDLIWFETDLVAQEIFDAYLDTAHFIWVPSVIHTSICGSIPETYGITKSSGNVFDIIKHAKPFLYPQSLEISTILQPAGIAYSSVEDLVKILEKYTPESPPYLRKANAAFEASEHFTVANQRIIHAPLFD